MEHNNFIKRYLDSINIKNDSAYHQRLYRMFELNDTVNRLNDEIVIKNDREILLTRKQIVIENEIFKLTEEIDYKQHSKQVLIDEMERLIKGKKLNE